MAQLRPFRALRPDAAYVSKLAAPPYDVVTREQARKLMEGNPFSFLHVSRADADLPQEDPYSPKIYAQGKAHFEKLIQDRILIQDSTPSLYVYRQSIRNHEQTGIVGTFAIDEYNSGVIKKHERTRKDKEDDRTRHILTLKAQTGPVFLAYRQVNSLAMEIAKIKATRSLYDFEKEGVQHTVWAVQDTSKLVTEFREKIPALYIADGHHRAASASRAQHELGPQSSDAFLAVAFPDSDMNILPYHRTVAEVPPAAQFLEQLRANFTVQLVSTAVPKPKQIGMYLNGQWYLLNGDVSFRFDVDLLQEKVLAPLLKIADPRTDSRIDFVGGVHGHEELQRRVDSGSAAVAFALHAVSIQDVMSVADEGKIMPPKSTWFEPKLADGLFVHAI